MSRDPGSLPDPQFHVFETYFRVRFHEVDALGHVNNAAYLNYLEQAAIDHATFLGLDLPRLQELGGVFVARRHEIVFLRPTFAGDVLRVVTWLAEPRGARVDRHYLVFREHEAVSDLPVGGRPITSPVSSVGTRFGDPGAAAADVQASTRAPAARRPVIRRLIRGARAGPAPRR